MGKYVVTTVVVDSVGLEEGLGVGAEDTLLLLLLSAAADADEDEAAGADSFPRVSTIGSVIARTRMTARDARAAAVSRRDTILSAGTLSLLLVICYGRENEDSLEVYCSREREPTPVLDST